MNDLPISEHVNEEIEILNDSIKKAIERFNKEVGIKIQWLEVSSESEFTLEGNITTYVIESNVHD